MAWTKVGPANIFLLYALGEAARAIAAFDEAVRLSHIVHERQPGVQALELKSVLDQLRLGISASASVSRVFWPAFNRNTEDLERAKARAVRLRELCRIPPQHALKDRTLRDAVDHFDERLDAWVGDAPRPYLTDQTVAHPLTVNKAEYLSEAALLVYDVVNNEVLILGRRLSIIKITEGLEDIRALISKALVSLDWDD